MFKICSKCKESKSLDCFGKCNTAKDGKQWNCKDCKKLYKQQHKEHIAQQQKEYRRANAVDNLKKSNKVDYA